MKNLSSILSSAKHFRRLLHENPRVSGSEAETAQRIIDYLSSNSNQTLQPIKTNVGGGHGIIYELEGTKNHSSGGSMSGGNKSLGPSVLLRADMDALPLIEANAKQSLSHTSSFPGAHHACGHDGHTAMLAAALLVLDQNRHMFEGRVVAMFQPSEEDGVGAKQMLLAEPYLLSKNITRGSYGFHNIPGIEVGKVSMTPSGVATRSSCGLRISIVGKASHSSQPELGINPAPLIANLVSSNNSNGLTSLPHKLLSQGLLSKQLKDPVMVTLVHLNMGNNGDFGISPANGMVCATLRADTTNDVALLLEHAKAMVSKEAEMNQCEVSFEVLEHFPSTINDLRCTRVIEQVVGDIKTSQEQGGKSSNDVETLFRGLTSSYDSEKLSLTHMDMPFPWSEDFGHFSYKYPLSFAGMPEEMDQALNSGSATETNDMFSGGAYFGLGSGCDHPALHSKYYDFNDSLIPIGVDLWTRIALKSLETKTW